MSQPAQSFDNHAKIVPAYHGVTTALLVLPTLYFMYQAIMDFSVEHALFFLFCVGVIMATFFARLFPLGVQDRVIRLEERLRMQSVLPPELCARIPEFTTEQLVGLRFASDEELPSLAKRTLDEGISDRNDIKRAVKTWRADDQRI
jgi:Family of unknown function (DUF6526)